MKTCKKYLFPLVALTLCMMMFFSTGALMADTQETTVVSAVPTDPIQPTSDDLDVGGLVSGVLGDVDPTLGDEIRDTAYETQGFLRYITEIIDKISDFFSNLLNAILGTFTKDKLF